MVQRFNMEEGDHGPEAMIEPDGEWVGYDDYAELEAILDMAKERLWGRHVKIMGLLRDKVSLEAEVAEIKAAVNWHRNDRDWIKPILTEPCNGATSYDGEWYDTYAAAVLVAYRAYLAKSGDDSGGG